MRTRQRLGVFEEREREMMMMMMMNRDDGEGRSVLVLMIISRYYNVVLSIHLV